MLEEEESSRERDAAVGEGEVYRLAEVNVPVAKLRSYSTIAVLCISMRFMLLFVPLASPQSYWLSE